jgi:signal recognition particle subunit SRP54
LALPVGSRLFALSFDALGDKLEQVFKRLRGHGKITERHMTEALREVRMALLEADVALPVVTKFIDDIRDQALGQEVLQSLTPEQHLLKFIHLELIRTMGDQAAVLDLGVPPPVSIMLVGLQGSGKTTSSAQLARHLKLERGRRPTSSRGRVSPGRIEQRTAPDPAWLARTLLDHHAKPGLAAACGSRTGGTTW